MSIVLAVRILTYNHEPFIRQCLDSVINQETTFAFKVVIGEDFSTDKTAMICKEYQDRYPEKIILRCAASNNLQVNSSSNWDNCFKLNPKYIALLEGDDYWTDPCKLQKQVDFLEANTDYALCYHPVNVLFPDGTMEEDFIVKGLIDKPDSNIYDLATLGNYIHTPSVVFRNIIREFPYQFYQASIGDFFIYMLLAQQGNLYKLPDNMAVYRYGVGIHSSKTSAERSKKWIETLKLIQECVEDKTVKRILEYRIDNDRLHSLPKNIRGLEAFDNINKAKVLSTFVGPKELIKALFEKIKR